MDARAQLIAFVIALILVGAAFNATYDRGYRAGRSDGYYDGLQAGREYGQQEGERAAILRFFPGGDPHLDGVWGAGYRVLVFAGAIKVIGALLFAIVFLIRRGTGRQIVGKIIMGALGTVLVFWLSRAVGFSAFLRHAALQPVASSALFWFLRGVGAAVMVYAAIATFRRIFVRTQVAVWVDAWCILVITAVVTPTVPVLMDTLFAVPDINRYLSSDVLPGALMGGLFYLAQELLGADSTAFAAAPRTKPKELLLRP